MTLSPIKTEKHNRSLSIITQVLIVHIKQAMVTVKYKNVQYKLHCRQFTLLYITMDNSSVWIYETDIFIASIKEERPYIRMPITIAYSFLCYMKETLGMPILSII